jgi:hypothetical protein
MEVTNQIQPHEGDIIIPPEVKPYSKRNLQSKEKVEQKNNAPKKIVNHTVAMERTMLILCVYASNVLMSSS